MAVRIVIVEDLEEIRDAVKNFFAAQTEFFLLDSFVSADEALYYLPKLSPDVVIMDINLPGTNGIEAIRQLKGTMKDTQFMMFTVYDTDEKVFEALEAGASGYLLKSTSLPQVAEAVKELHAGGSPMSGGIARKVVAAFQQKEKEVNVEVDLSPREAEVLQLLSKGLLYKEIGASLGISTGTVKQHIHKIYEKLHVQNRTEALNKAFGGPSRLPGGEVT